MGIVNIRDFVQRVVVRPDQAIAIVGAGPRGPKGADGLDPSAGRVLGSVRKSDNWTSATPTVKTAITGMSTSFVWPDTAEIPRGVKAAASLVLITNNAGDVVSAELNGSINGGAAVSLDNDVANVLIASVGIKALKLGCQLPFAGVFEPVAGDTVTLSVTGIRNSGSGTLNLMAIFFGTRFTAEIEAIVR